MRITIISFFLVFSFSINAQYYDSFEVPVSQGLDEIQFPFTGGFDAPQFSNTDINNDGLLDVYVFDRNGSVSSVFLRKMESAPYPFEFTKHYNRFFPKTLEGFSLLKDFNGDGIDDIFASAIPQGAAGVTVYQASRVNGEYSYKIRRMGRPSGPEIIWNRLPAGQVYCAVTDIPAITDVDNDGDLDILSFDEAGSYVYFCRNYQVENGFANDTMDFRIEDFCFGKFQESGLSQTIKLSSNPSLCAKEITVNELPDSKNGVHSGSTVFAFDPDNDGDKDLLLGDLTYNGIVFLENGGNPEAAFMTDIDSRYPEEDIPVEMPVFLSAFEIDADNDGFQDFVVAPNALSSSQNVNNAWLYRNTSKEGPQGFTLETRSFLADETLDYGSLSAPAITDYNADGLMDIVIGAGGPFEGFASEMRLVLLENTGSSTNPEFVIVDEDYLDFSQYSSSSSNPSPCFGDLDQDGDMDLLIGDESGKLFFFENIAGPGNRFEFANPVYNWMDITAGQRIRPTIYDFNGDGLNDLIIGERNTNGYNDPESGELLTGNINYYQNQGSMGEPFFDPVVTNAPNTPTFGQIRVNFSVSTSARGGASPYFFHRDNELLCLVGSSGGRISLYRIDSENVNDPAQLMDDRLGGLIEGYWSAPIAYDFDADGFFELLIGNIRGGLSFFKTDIMGTTSTSEAQSQRDDIQVYPNPSTGQFNIQMPGGGIPVQCRVFDMNGKTVYSTKGKLTLDLRHLEAGIYGLMLLDSEGRSYSSLILLANPD